MNIMIINCGSSSQSFSVYTLENGDDIQRILSGKARNVATTTLEKPRIDYKWKEESFSIEVPLPTHRDAANNILQIIQKHGLAIDVIGHRFVHGGKWLTSTTKVTPQSAILVEKCLPLAPIHNPNSWSVVQVFTDNLPKAPQYLVFDTAFHDNMPAAARAYAIPRELVDEYGFCKYGFHGLSYQFVSSAAAKLLNISLKKVKLIMCHLGTGGSSVAAFMDGHTIGTSMGYSPLPGLVMSTRCGDLDPEIVLELVRQGKSADEIENILNHQSGLIGLSGYSSNLDEIIKEAKKGNQNCKLAYEVYVNRLKQYIGGYFWQMNGADAILFTDDIGTHSWKLREKVCGDVEHLGIVLDRDANRTVSPQKAEFFQTPDSKVKLLSLPTDEESIIMDEVVRAVRKVS